MILDVGCGANPRGDVNCDLFTGISHHTKFEIKPKQIKNFVQCDALHLPFRRSSFDTVACYEVIEHVDRDKTFKLLSELVRVSSDKIIVTTPHRWTPRPSMHTQHFTRTWFRKAWKKLHCTHLAFQITAYRYLPHPFLPLVRLPAHIKVVIRK